MVSSWPTRWVSRVCSGFQDWTCWLLRCNALQVLYWDEDTREAPEQFCRYFFSLAPSDSARLRPQAVSYTVFYWLCMLCQDCSPFRLARYSCLPSDELGWSPTLPYVIVLATATELLPAGRAAQCNLAANNTLSLLINTSFDARQNLWENSEGLRRNCVQLMHVFLTDSNN